MKLVIVSDHALLRYIQRVHGVDIDQLRDIVFDIIEDAALAGATKFSIGGFTYAITQRRDAATLTTVLPEATPSKAAWSRGKRSQSGLSPSSSGQEGGT